ncbi:MAG: UDP-N-acetylmuramoyl-L-alanine--D-glutamate ligase [Bacteriovoracaceae bacterium]|nr:UDP-N-acetylmuramoyl-L-alanine--D-glutamate ligase [Bacteriovoracaceae bacterium]
MELSSIYKGKKVLIVGLGKTGFALIHFFNNLGCEIRVTDIKPIFDLNKQVKRLKKIQPNPEMTLGEHRDEDFLSADLVVYSSSIDPKLPQIQLAIQNGREVYSEFAFSYKHCKKPIIAVCGSIGRTTIANMIGFTLRVDKKNVFVGGTSEEPFINFYSLPNRDEIDYVVVEASPWQLQTIDKFHPVLTIFPNIDERFTPGRFANATDYFETCLNVVKNLTQDDYMIVNFDKLSGNSALRNADTQTYWYSRKSFVSMGVISEIQGTHFHEKRIHSNIHYYSEFKVNKMRIVGTENRENLLAAITACKALKVSDDAIQNCIQKFPGIPNSLEFIVEKNGVKFYNDSKSENMDQLKISLDAFKDPVILIAGGKESEQDYEKYRSIISERVRIMVLVGESKEGMNRLIGDSTQTFMVGSFDESILLAYQKSRTGDVILLCPGHDSTDIFRDFEEKGNYYKKLIFQL